MPDKKPTDPIRAQDKMSVVVVAAGKSTRMQGVDKLLLPISGRPVLWHSLTVFNECEWVNSVVVVVQSERIAEFRDSIANGGFSKRISVVAGGDRRQDSVCNGIEELQKLGDQSPFVVIHDAARPFIDVMMLRRGLTTAERVGAAIPVVAVKDTIKQVEHGLVVDTPSRESMFSVQTPQIFRTEILRAAHDTVKCDVTDDASMVETAGGLVGTFEGSYDNIKITTQSDIPIAEVIASGQVHPTSYRHGIGFDGHRFADGGPLILGGVQIDFDMHLEGHSDGDVLMHAIASAILGAAGLGDLGSNFPSSDQRYADIASSLFIKDATAKAAELDWQIDYMDATVIAQRPRLASHVTAFESNIADAMGVEIDRVNVKITSTDKVGAIGQGEGIAAQAIVTLVR